MNDIPLRDCCGTPINCFHDAQCTRQEAVKLPKPIKCYIAGPMTGLPEHNFPAFHEVAARVRAKGWLPLNPAENFGGRRDLERAVYFRKDFELLLEADATAFLPGWRDSKGARCEYAVAAELGHELLDAVTLEPLADESILDEAARITSGARRRDYGTPLENHQRIADLWNAYLRLLPEGALGPEQVAWMMILLKVARQIQTPKYDNVLDTIGYAKCIHEMRQELEAA